MAQEVFGHLNVWISLYYRNIKASVIHFKEKYTVQVKHFHKKNTRCCILISYTYTIFTIFHIHILYTYFKLAFLYVTCIFVLFGLSAVWLSAFTLWKSTKSYRGKLRRKLNRFLTTIRIEFLGELFLYVSKHFWATICKSVYVYLSEGAGFTAGTFPVFGNSQRGHTITT